MTPSRRTVLRTALAAVPFAAGVSMGDATGCDPAAPFRALESRYGARLGVYAVNLRTGRALRHRAGERFAICSVFKSVAVAAVLRDLAPAVLDRRIHYTERDLVENSPVTSAHLAGGMTVRELADAAIRFSDNTAGNLLLRLIGGPHGLTRFVRSIGDRTTRLDRWETELNTSYPGDPRDTTTPAAIGSTYRRLLLGGALEPRDATLLKDWMLANQTSFTRFRAGLPEGWTLADKTGAGGYGSVNDVGLAWKPDGTPVLMAALSVKPGPDAVADNGLLADTARIITSTL